MEWGCSGVRDMWLSSKKGVDLVPVAVTMIPHPGSVGAKNVTYLMQSVVCSCLFTAILKLSVVIQNNPYPEETSVTAPHLVGTIGFLCC